LVVLEIYSLGIEENKTGIPYAEPPLGGLRLKPPVLKTDVDVETFDASNFGAVCLQPVRLLSLLPSGIRA